MKKLSFLLALCIILLFIVTTAYNRPRIGSSLNTRKVAATIFPIFDITRNIAGDTVETVLIVDPGVSPHSFDPSPDDVKKIHGSRAIFMIGYGIDDWSTGLAQSSGIDVQIVLDRNVNLREFTNQEAHKDDTHDTDDSDDSDDSETGIDPHYWLSVKNAIGIAEQVRDELIILYPENKEMYERNYLTYKAQLTDLDKEIRSELTTLKRRDIATFHNAWGYFAREYELNIVTTFEEFPGEEPSPEYIYEFTNKIRKYDVKVIYAEPHFSTSSLEPIANDLDIQISQLAPEGMTGITTYIELMRYNGLQISKSL